MVRNQEKCFFKRLNKSNGKGRKKIGVLICCILVLLLTKNIDFSVFFPLQGADEYLVTRVVDGDTIVINDQGEVKKVRLIGVNTPESVHADQSKNVPYGKIASEFTKAKLEGKKVKIEYDVQKQDPYGRLLAYVYIEGVMFNQLLLQEGHATVATYPPNVKYVEDFVAWQKQAQQAGKGLWK